MIQSSQVALSHLINIKEIFWIIRVAFDTPSWSQPLISCKANLAYSVEFFYTHSQKFLFCSSSSYFKLFSQFFRKLSTFYTRMLKFKVYNIINTNSVLIYRKTSNNKLSMLHRTGYACWNSSTKLLEEKVTSWGAFNG